MLVRHRLARDQPGQGDPQHEAVARPATSPASQPVTSTVQPSSSAISRTTAASADSPGSTLPPGNSQRPARGGGYAAREHATVVEDRGTDDGDGHEVLLGWVRPGQ